MIFAIYFILVNFNFSTGEINLTLIIYPHYFIFLFSKIWFKHQINASTAIVFSAASINSYNYGVTGFWLIYFIISTVLLNTIYIDLVSITEKKVSFFCLKKSCFYNSTVLFFSEQHKVIVCVILTTYLHWFLSPFSKIWFESDSSLPL